MSSYNSSLKLVRQSKLFFQEGTSDKVYEIDLCESGDGFLVNFRYGRRGAALKEGTKTVFPIPRAEADKVFLALEQEKRKKGYVAAGEAPIVTAGEAKSGGASVEKRKKAIIKLLKGASNGEETGNWPLPRIMWRAGDLKISEAVPYIIKSANEADVANIHSVVWAIGRCGSADAIGFLQGLQQKTTIPAYTRELATDALLKLCTTKDQHTIKDVLAATLTSSLREAISTNDHNKLDKTLRELLFELKTSSNDFLLNVYRLTSTNEKMKAVLLSIIPQLHFTTNNFYAIRRIFKAAEMTEDYQTYGIIAKQFEAKPAAYQASRWIKPEVKKTRGFSHRTKLYLSERVLRELRKLGEAESSSYTQLATGVLLAFEEKDAIQPYSISKYEYKLNEVTKRHDRTRKQLHYDAFSKFQALNYILFKNSKRYTPAKAGWTCVDPYTPGQRTPLDREEAFPSLWNNSSDDVIRLLSLARVNIISEFAVKIWTANPSFEKDVTTEDIVQFFASPFVAVQQIGLTIATKRYDRANPDFGLLLAMLNSAMNEARHQVELWLIGAQRETSANTEFMVRLLQLQRPEAHEWIRKYFASHTFDQQQAELIVAKVIAHTITSKEENGKEIVLTGDTVVALFPGVLKNISLTVVQDLFRHPSPEVHTFAGKILLAHSVSPEQLPPDFLQLLLQSTNSGTRSIGISLLGKLPDPLLLEKKDILVSFCLSPQADVRAAVRPVMLKLVKAYPALGGELVELFVPAILMKETYEGVHDDIISLLSNELADGLATISKEKTLKLVASRFRAPQMLGVVLLKRHVKFSELEVAQVVKLADNSVEEVRKMAWAEFQANPAKMKYFVLDALKITDSDWDDTRLFAFNYFRDQFTATDWTPELLILLCDSIREDVQDFGRELITKFFDPKFGTEYLLKLSQHPSTRVQLFATAYLEQFAGGQPEIIEVLSSYFVTLLSQVNKGKTAKKRIMHFLRTQSLLDERTARLAASVFARVSVSVAIAERAECIAALKDIQQKFETIQSPLKVKSHGDYVNK